MKLRILLYSLLRLDSLKDKMRDETFIFIASGRFLTASNGSTIDLVSTIEAVKDCVFTLVNRTLNGVEAKRRCVIWRFFSASAVSRM